MRYLNRHKETGAPACRVVSGSPYWRIEVAAVAALFAALALMVVLPKAAAAYELHGCKYDPDSISPISYRFFSVSDDHEDAFGDGQADWDSAYDVPGHFSERSASPDPEINVIDGSYSSDNYALASWACSSGEYSGNEVTIDFDASNTGSLTDAQRVVIAVHELGHAYGLDERSWACRVMNVPEALNACTSFPAADDRAGVRDVYP